MSSSWSISVGGRSYGPYSLEQMKAFRAEGRLAPHSLVARDGAEHFLQAAEDAELAALFSAPAQKPATEPATGEISGGPAKLGRGAGASGERNRFIIIAEMKSGSIAALDETILGLGSSFSFLPQSWILASAISLSTLRGELIQKLGKLDTLFIVDTTHDKAAWFNFGPEADAKMRLLWQRDGTPARKSA